MTGVQTCALPIWELVDAITRAAPLQCVAATAGDPLTVAVPSNYGYVLVSPA